MTRKKKLAGTKARKATTPMTRPYVVLWTNGIPQGMATREYNEYNESIARYPEPFAHDWDTAIKLTRLDAHTLRVTLVSDREARSGQTRTIRFK